MTQAACDRAVTTPHHRGYVDCFGGDYRASADQPNASSGEACWAKAGICSTRSAPPSSPGESGRVIVHDFSLRSSMTSAGAASNPLGGRTSVSSRPSAKPAAAEARPHLRPNLRIGHQAFAQAVQDGRFGPACLRTTTEAIEALIDEGTVKRIDSEAAARLVNGAALNASLWIAASADPRAVFAKAVEAFRHLASGLLESGDSRHDAAPRPAIDGGKRGAETERAGHQSQ